jgi:hypothetical protein
MRKADSGKPNPVSNQERRRHPRQKANRSAEVLVFLGDRDGGSQYVTATPIDYSVSGMQLETDTALEVGASVVLRTLNPGRKLAEQGRAAAKVVWCKQRWDGRFRAGVVFSNPLETLSEDKSQ